ncbi:MAG TPA: hypothetical protein VM219_04825 [Phycisphaerae bacterium]|nr:hypothetical protein [Phycisphaerae bacterium]
MAKRKILATDSILVQCRVNKYFRDKASGKVYSGPVGRAGTPKRVEGSPPFRVSRLRWERDAGLPDGQRIFQQVGEEDAPAE